MPRNRTHQAPNEGSEQVSLIAPLLLGLTLVCHSFLGRIALRRLFEWIDVVVRECLDVRALWVEARVLIERLILRLPAAQQGGQHQVCPCAIFSIGLMVVIGKCTEGRALCLDWSENTCTKAEPESFQLKCKHVSRSSFVCVDTPWVGSRIFVRRLLLAYSVTLERFPRSLKILGQKLL